MILIIGAAGNIGLPVLKHLCKQNAAVRAFVHSEKSVDHLKSLGVTDVRRGDIRIKNDVYDALQGCHSVFHVMPPFSEDEFTIGRQTIVTVQRYAQIDSTTTTCNHFHEKASQ
ncbi:MAG: SDR family oxidoreductase [Desulfopila sp.]